LLFVIVGS